jgi:hypothetical protein
MKHTRMKYTRKSFFHGERFKRTNLIDNLFGDLAKDRRCRVANLVDNLVADLVDDQR